MKTHLTINLKSILVLSILCKSLLIFGQQHADSLNDRHLYRPRSTQSSEYSNEQYPRETPQHYNQDSVNARLKYIQDSIAVRMEFVRDSILAREQFIKDSIQRRERILDSLNFLRAQLPRLLDACLKTVEDDLIIEQNDVLIIGDSILSNYTYQLLPFNMTLPFTPWKASVNLSDNPIHIKADFKRKIIHAIQTSFIDCSFKYHPRSNIVIIYGKSTILNKRTGKFYKVPTDSVFFDNRGRVLKTKSYVGLYTVTSNYQKGSPVLSYLAQVKQYQYSTGKRFTKLQIVSFCERWSKADPQKVCNILDYTLSKQGNTYILSQKSDPVNDYADGTFRFEFDYAGHLQHVSFKNIKNTEDWKTTLEVNDAGNVSRYIYRKSGKVNKTLLVNYYLDDPSAKYKFETVTCVFEDDGISYYQKNNTTGKSRVRDRLTGEWSPWQ
jgi:hypothetical protein